MVKCEKCGGELLWLFVNKGSQLLVDPDKFVETDYVMCEDCETVYKRVIHTDVGWLELQTLHRSAKEEE